MGSGKSYRILLLDTKRGNPNHYLCIAIENALRENPNVEFVARAQYGTAISTAIREKCNLFIAFDGEDIDTAVCSKIAQICGKSAVWFTEDPYEVPHNLKTAPFFDLVFTNDSKSVQHYGSKGRHLPFAASRALHYQPLRTEGHLYDVLFVGTAWPNRVKTLKYLLDHFPPNLRYKFALPYNVHLAKPKLGIPKSEFSWKASNLEFCRMANRSKIVLTLHRQFSSSKGGESAETPGPRLFEVAMAGGFQLVDLGSSATEDYFKEGTAIAGFRSDEECLEKIQYYLEKAKTRGEFAAEAQNLVLKNHTYAERVSDLLKEVDSLPTKKVQTPAKKKPKLLVVTHNTIASPPFGGVEVYQDALTKRLSSQFDVLTYSPLKKGASAYGKALGLLDSNGRVLETFNFSTKFSDDELSDLEKERAFSGILKKHSIEAVHFQHLVGHPPSLPLIAKAWGLPTFLSLHDFFVGCKNYNLIDFRGKYCGAPAVTIQDCDQCLSSMDGALAGSQSARRAFFSRVLESVDVFFLNTPLIAEMFKNFYPGQITDKKIRIIPPPMTRFTKTSPGSKDTGRLKIALLGNFGPSKGSSTALKVFEKTKGLDVEFHIFGHISQTNQLDISKGKFSHVFSRGSFDRNALPELLKDFSLSLHLSPWPETFCITLSEAWQLNLVPIVTNVGALGERVKNGVNGFKVNIDDGSETVVKLIQDFIKDRSLVAKTRNQITLDAMITEDQHVEAIAQEFLNSLNATSLGDAAPLRLDLEKMQIELNHRDWMIRSGMRAKRSRSLFDAPFIDVARKSFSYFRSHGVLNLIVRAAREVTGGYRK
jgi:glycosyltransferase involved in cell wall biosynthesis/spore maturation protein CgeB